MRIGRGPPGPGIARSSTRSIGSASPATARPAIERRASTGVSVWKAGALALAIASRRAFICGSSGIWTSQAGIRVYRTAWRVQYDAFRVDGERASRSAYENAPRWSNVQRGEAFEFRRIAIGSHARTDLHDDEAMGAGGLVFVEAALHGGAIAAQLALEDGDVEAVVIGAGLIAFLAQAEEVFVEHRRRQEDRAPAVAPSRDPAEGVFVLAADKDWRTARLGRFRIHAHGGKAHVFAVEGRFRFSPQLAHRGDIFAGLRPAMGKIDAEHFGFFAEPAGADSEHHASGGKMIERRDFLGGDQRVAFRHQHHAGGEFQARGDSGRHRHRDERVGDMRIDLGNLTL